MDFLEKIFAISPDGGSGALELLLLALPVAGMIYLRLWRIGRRAGHSRTQKSTDSRSARSSVDSS